VAIIGCGDIGFLFDKNKKSKGALTHFRAFNNSGRFKIAAIAELKESTRKFIEKNFNIPAYKNYIKLFKEVRPDVVAVATNDDTHFEILNEAVKYNPKLVFTEKPLAVDYGSVRSITEIYRKRKIHLQVNYTRRFMKEFEEIGKMIKDGTLGKVESATFYYSRGLIHNASHYIDLVKWYFGDLEKGIVKISEKKGISRIDNTVSFNMKYKDGLEVRFIGLNPTKLTFVEIDIAGNKGRIRFNHKNEIEKYRVIPHKIFSGYSSYEMYECKEADFTKALPDAVNNIYETLEGRAKLKSSGINSLKIFELIKKIKEKRVCLN